MNRTKVINLIRLSHKQDIEMSIVNYNFSFIKTVII
jgi:hypothetical protein